MAKTESATRAAALREAIEAARGEYLHDQTGTPEDEAYNQAVSDVVAAIGALLENEKRDERLLPTGYCWCGCGTETGIGSFFTRGHDKTAEAALMKAEYGGTVPRLLAAHSYGPGRSVTDAAVRNGWVRCPIPGCKYVGAEASVRKHEAMPHKEK